jgi:hypothetical protein
MKLTKVQIERMVRMVISELKTQKIVTLKAPEDKVFKRGVELINEEYQSEKDLEIEAKQMVDDLERKQGGGFERHKMYLMIKSELAKKKGVIL